MPNSSRFSKPDLEIEEVEAFGNTDDPTYIKLVQCALEVIRDVHLVHGSDMAISTGHLEHAHEPWSMVLLVIHGIEVLDGDFADATKALLISKAPLVNWTVHCDELVKIMGQYETNMPVSSVQ